MASEKPAGWPARVWAAIGGGLVALVGAALLAGGAWLIVLQGSPYYLLAGAAILGAGVMLVRRHPAAGLVYAAVLAVTLGWGVWEGGFSFWPLLPRLFALAVLGLFILAVIAAAPKGAMRDRSGAAVALLSLVCLGVLGAAAPATWRWGQAEIPAQVTGAAPPAADASDWRYEGRDPGGSHYAPIDQINRENVDDLKVAWTFHPGAQSDLGQAQGAPLQVGDTLYVCTPTNGVIALDADTGKAKWRRDPKANAGASNRCRSLGYWDGTTPKAASPKLATASAAAKSVPAKPPASKAAPAKPTTPLVQKVAGPAPAAPLCRRRIIVSTADARLLALDAPTGRLCPGFGKAGVVDLTAGVGPVGARGDLQPSTPAVVGDRVVVGARVADHQALGGPPGVVRAFDAVTGELVWAWDLGDPAVEKLPPGGKTYTRGTPDLSATPAFDPGLGLVYLPLGDAAPAHWGSHRAMASEAYSSSVVAVDVKTGRMRWAFQTVHHDLWDYDLASQPMLIDFPVKGGVAPALVQLTRRGQIFVLDRRDGKPLTRVVEVRVPGGAQPGEWVFPTQPYSVEMPTIGVERLTEEMMWGATPLDQLACRIMFQSMRYEGDFTPPGGADRPSLQYPGSGGGMNGGSGAFDARRGLLIVSDVRLPQVVSLIRSDSPDVAIGRADRDRPPPSLKAVSYKAKTRAFVSPASMPCVQPPHGMLTAIDLRTRQLVWQVPAGTAEAQGPFGLASHLPIPMGAISLGGPITTAGGVTFRAGADLRAYDNATGAVLWQAPLRAPSSGTPTTYVSPKTGKQYVVVTAGGMRGDVVAYALP